jgi:hypothetical protein
MAHLFALLDTVEKQTNFDKPSKIVKNVTSGPFVVDEDGRQIHSRGVAAVDANCKICEAGIKSGALVVIREVTSSNSASKVKPKEKEVVSAPVVEQEVPEVQETVAPTSQQ